MNSTKENVQIPLPEYPPVDTLVLEGSLFGIYLAGESAVRGRKTAIAFSDTSASYEMGSSLRPYMAVPHLQSLPEDLRTCLVNSVKHHRSDRVVFHHAKLMCSLEDYLLDRGVQLFYNTRPAFIESRSDGVISKVALGGKFGINLIPVQAVIDNSPYATVARCAGAEFELRAQSPRKVYYSVLCTNTTAVKNLVYSLPDSRSFDKVIVSTVDNYVEFCFCLRPDLLSAVTEPLFHSKLLNDVHATLSTVALDLSVSTMERPKILDAFFLGANALLAVPHDTLVCEKPTRSGFGFFPAGIPNLAVTGPVCREPGFDSLDQVINAGKNGMAFTSLGQIILSRMEGIDTQANDNVLKATYHNEYMSQFLHIDQTTEAATGNQMPGLSDPSFCEPGSTTTFVPESFFTTIPSVTKAAVVVAGGGTSGIPAAMTCAGRGVDTLCIEMHGEFGGANTIGGVSQYWFGNWTPFMKNHFLSMMSLVEEKRITTAMAHHYMAKESGARLLPALPLCGVVVEHTQIRAVYVLTPFGMGKIAGDQFIDATGDGDIAAWAGNSYDYGTGRDEITLWYSFGSFHLDKTEASRHYHSVVDQRSMKDTSLAILRGRRQIGVHGEAEHPQTFLAARESRHIHGRETVSYIDLAMNKSYPDTVCVMKSNLDVKGMASSDATLCGFIDQDYHGNLYYARCLTGSIPLRALQPCGFDNMLVVGRAYSITHDALSMARMQPDLINLGAAAGLVVAISVEDRTLCGEFPESKVHQVMIDHGILDFKATMADENTITPDFKEMKILGKRLVMAPLEIFDQARILSNPVEAEAMLVKEFNEQKCYYNGKLMARMLAMLGNSHANDYLLKILHNLEVSEWLPGKDCKYSPHNAPDHAWAPEEVFVLNALSFTGDQRLLPFLSTIVDKLKLSAEFMDYQFYYVYCLAYVLERMPCAAGIPLLGRVLANPLLENQDRPSGADPRELTNHTQERYAYLELCLSRSLARCGSKQGYRNLVRYLDDTRLYLCRSSYLELKALSGQDFGFASKAWLDWIDAQNEIPAIPYTRRQG